MTHRQSPAGWDEQRVQDIIARYGSVPEEGQVAGTEAPKRLTPEAIRVLCREIGVVNTAHIIQRMTGGYGNYTEERDQINGPVTVDDIFAEIERRRGK